MPYQMAEKTNQANALGARGTGLAGSGAALSQIGAALNASAQMGQLQSLQQRANTTLTRQPVQRMVEVEADLEPETDEAGTVAQRVVSVQILPNLADGNSIGGLTIKGRPPNTINSQEEGDHTTPWQVFLDELTRRLVGLSPRDAWDEVHEMVVEASELPGIDLVDNLPEDSWAHANYAAADTAIDLFLAQDVGTIPDLWLVAQLQQFIAAYLDYRNSIPLTAVSGGGKGNGEPERLKTIRAAEQGEEPDKDLHEALWLLLDKKTVDTVDDANDPYLVPGYAALDDDEEEDVETANERVAALLDQHLFTMFRAYPNAFSQAKMSDRSSVLAYLRHHVHMSKDRALAVMGHMGFNQFLVDQADDAYEDQVGEIQGYVSDERLQDYSKSQIRALIEEVFDLDAPAEEGVCDISSYDEYMEKLNTLNGAEIVSHLESLDDEAEENGIEEEGAEEDGEEEDDGIEEEDSLTPP